MHVRVCRSSGAAQIKHRSPRRLHKAGGAGHSGAHNHTHPNTNSLRASGVEREREMVLWNAAVYWINTQTEIESEWASNKPLERIAAHPRPRCRCPPALIITRSCILVPAIYRARRLLIHMQPSVTLNLISNEWCGCKPTSGDTHPMCALGELRLGCGCVYSHSQDC